MIGLMALGILIRWALNGFRGTWLDYDTPKDDNRNLNIGLAAYLVIAFLIYIFFFI